MYATRGTGVERLTGEVRRFWRAHGLTGPGVAAVSGGPDSVALLRLLADAGVGPLTVAHLNHRLRPSADADAAFVQELADRLGLPCRLGSIDVASLGGNLEAAGRAARYGWLAGVVAEVGATWVATGHTADDQAETVLHRLLRGTGLQGLRGIAAARPLPPLSRLCGRGVGGEGLCSWVFPCPPPRGGEGLGEGASASTSERLHPSPQPPPRGGEGEPNPSRSTLTPDPSPAEPGEGGRIVRPLLAVPRADLLAYLAAVGQPFRTDPSNADPRFTRNRIRHELLPQLRTFNPRIVSVLGRLAEQADEAFAEQERQAATLLAAAELPRAGPLRVFDRDRLSAAPPSQVRELFRRVWREEGWPLDPMTAFHWRRLAALAPGDYPGRVRLSVAGRAVRLGPAAPGV